MILNKRIIREFKENKIKYIGLILLIILSSMALVAFSNSADCVIQIGEKIAKENNLQDGEFQVKFKLDNFTLQKIHDVGVTVDENFYIDYSINNDKTLRLFKERKNLNKLSIVNGKNFSSDLDTNMDIILDEHFASVNKYSINHTLELNNSPYTVIGYGVAPDYSLVIKKITDSNASPENFGIGFISSNNFNKFNNNITYNYSFKLNGFSSEKFKNILRKNASLISFLNSKDNHRISGYIDDNLTNKKVGIILGVVLIIMISFIISVSIINTIDQESAIIGTLYSLGYLKNELLYHFLILPLILVSIGSVVGTFLGFLLARPLIVTSTEYYSLPYIPTIYTPSLLILGILVPILIVVIVNTYILSKRLNSSPLQLLRNEKKQAKMNTITIRHFSFITKFRLRQFLREYKSNLILLFGIIISTFLLIFGLGTNSAVKTYIQNITTENKFQYNYILNLPIEITENNDVEKTTVTSLSIFYEDLGQNIDLTFQGIKENSKFYNFNIKNSDPGIYISNNIHNKLGLNIGDTMFLKDTSNNKIYNLKVSGIVDYSTGLYVFMNREQMNLLLDKSKSYFNSYLSSKKLNINDKYIASLVTKESLIKSCENMTASMSDAILLVIIFASIMFVITMYLLLKLIIDKNTYSISLLKVLGYTQKELNKLYLGSSFYVVLVSALIAIPLCAKITKALWPNLTSDLQTYMPISLTGYDYLFMFIIIFTSYYISLYFLKRHLYSIPMTEALKNRD
ncbi:ABC transporter permease [Clostridium sp. YIM B02555]|uniref:ABC transporter permease n=1 Tax=Clostridium sp. YIM B02555 TaxID=2911968 RepID=UPI001EEE8C0D|nr:ABC transporter permease [Clostridium sp. YIM B02555]